MSLFFINRPIKQERPPSTFYFVRLLPVSLSLFLPPCLSPLSLRSFFSSLSRIPLLVSPSLFRFVSFRYPGRTSSPTFSYSYFSIARKRTLCRLGPEQFFFCYFIQLFREREESFYYLDARLQCLADNKPMKATFELEGPLKSPFSPTSRFFVSFTHSHFLSFSSSLIFSRIFPFSFSFPLSLTWYHPSSVSLRVMPAVKISRRFFASSSALRSYFYL